MSFDNVIGLSIGTRTDCMTDEILDFLVEKSKDKDVNYHELYFIEDDFWFDFGEFYFILNSDDYLYEKIYHLKFIIIIFNPEKKVIQTLNFSNN